MSNTIQILSTRPITEELIEEAKASGVLIDVVPFIETEPIRTIEVQQEIEYAYLQSIVVVFTSMNAVEAVVMEQQGQIPDWNIYCIGHATKQLVIEHFGEDKIMGIADSAIDLAEEIISDELSDEVYFFCGDQRRDELPKKLREHDIDVYEIVVYQTIKTPRKISKSYHGILFFSPSAVESFFTVNKSIERTLLFAIGNTTASTIGNYTNNRVIISDSPGKESMVRQAIEFFT